MAMNTKISIMDHIIVDIYIYIESWNSYGNEYQNFNYGPYHSWPENMAMNKNEMVKGSCCVDLCGYETN